MFSNIQFTHRIFNGPEEHIPAMNRIKDLVCMLFKGAAATNDVRVGGGSNIPKLGSNNTGWSIGTRINEC